MAKNNVKKGLNSPQDFQDKKFVLAFIVTWFIGIGLFVYLFGKIILPFVMGGVLAYILSPAVMALRKFGLSRVISTLVIVGPFFLFLILMVFFLAPMLSQQVMKFISLMPKYLASFYETFSNYTTQFSGKLEELHMDGMSSLTPDMANVGHWLKVLLTNIITNTFAFINIITLLLIMPVALFFLLKDWDKMREKLYSWMPKQKAVLIKECLGEMNTMISGYLRGQATVCLILACLYAVVLRLAGLEFGILIGVLTGILSFIPYVGATVGFVATMLVAFYQFDQWQNILIVAAVFAGIQVLEGAFLTPKIVGGKVGLHPLWIIFAILAGGFLMGFVGVLIAVPLAAMIGVLVRYGVRAYLASPFYND